MGDPLHQQVIAADLGLHLLDTQLRKAMPRPRSKLNRPFDAVNLY